MADAAHLTAYELLQLLKSERTQLGLSGGAPEKAQAQLLGFVSNLHDYLEKYWNTDEEWAADNITSRLVLGELRFSALGAKVATPKHLVEALAEFLEEEEKTLDALFPALEEGPPGALGQVLAELKKATTTSQAQEQLQNLLEVLQFTPPSENENLLPFPTTVENELRQARLAAVHEEEEYEKLFLHELGDKLQEALKEAEDEGQVDEDKLLKATIQRWQELTANLQEARARLVENEITNRTFPSSDKVGKDHLPIFVEHPAEGFDEEELNEKEVFDAAKEYWIVLQEKAAADASIDKDASFRWAVLDTYRFYTRGLGELADRETPTASALQQEIANVLNITIDPNDRLGEDSGGAAATEGEEPTAPPEEIPVQPTEEEVPADAPPADLSPEEAAQRAQGITPESAAPADETPQSQAERLLAQLKDVGKLTAAQSTLTNITLKMLEDELHRRYPDLTPGEIATFLQENHQAISQMVWTNYLQSLATPGASIALDSTLLARISVSSSQYFADKFALDTLRSNEFLNGDSARAAFSGPLDPELEKRLQALILEEGYASTDELLADIFGSDLSREAALQRFVALAEQSASFNPEKIASFTRGLISSVASDTDIEVILVSLNKDQSGLRDFLLQLPVDQLPLNTLRNWDRLATLAQKAATGSLTAKEEIEANQLLQELAPLFQLYQTFGAQFYALRFGMQDLNQYTAELHRYGQVEQAMRASGEGEVLVRQEVVIPVVFQGVVFARLAQIEDANERRTGIPLSTRGNLALMNALAANNEAGHNALGRRLTRGPQRRTRAQQPLTVAQWQRMYGQNWTQHTFMRAGGPQGLAMRQAGGSAAKSRPGQLFGGFMKNPVVRKVLITMGSTIISGLGALASFVGSILVAMGPFAFIAVPVAYFLAHNALQGFASGLANAGNALPTSATTGFAKEVAAGAGDAASKASIGAREIAQAQASNISSGVGAVGTRTLAILNQTTTMAKTSTAIIAGGLILPFAFSILMTFIVWAVIGNSFNDYSGSPLARRNLGLERCWPAEGFITGMRVYPNGGHHATSPNGTAIDIAKSPAGSPVYSPFSGEGKSYYASDYGNYVRITTDQGFAVLFAHLLSPSIPNTTTQIQAGDQIGLMGTSGSNTTGVHVHYELIDTQRRGIEVFDVLPLPESQLTFNMPVLFSQCRSPLPQPSVEPTAPTVPEAP